ncbi:MAG: hypothetical protein ACXWLR_11860, partial [Myxococcales bacterium]
MASEVRRRGVHPGEALALLLQRDRLRRGAHLDVLLQRAARQEVATYAEHGDRHLDRVTGLEEKAE